MTAGDGVWAGSARASYVFVPYDRLQQGRDPGPNPSGLAIDVHLATLQLHAIAPTSTSLDAQLPFGSLVTRTMSDRRTDHGLGDLELRVRQGLARWIRAGALDHGVAAGVVLPTGEYVPRAGAANLAPEASYLTLGRGVAWWLLEADARIPLGRRASMFAQTAGRGPVGRARDGFAWGSELRATFGGQVAIAGRVAGVASTELQWRGGATEPDPFSANRLESANAGGWQWSASLACSAELTRDVGLVAGLRAPLASDVTGNQLVPALGVFAAVSFTYRGVRARSATIPAALGMITVVDYWASWCEPCVEIDRRLAEAAARWTDVRIVKVDASAWPDPPAPQLPGGATGLPVIELVDTTGARKVLTGKDALRIVEEVDALRARRVHSSPGAPR